MDSQSKQRLFEMMSQVDKTFKSKLNESKKFKVNPKYTHFAVWKDTNKIATGWDYGDIESEELRSEKKYYFINDLIDWEIDPKKVKILNKKTLERNNINPFDWSNWESNNNEVNEIAYNDLKSNSFMVDKNIKNVFSDFHKQHINVYYGGLTSKTPLRINAITQVTQYSNTIPYEPEQEKHGKQGTQDNEINLSIYAERRKSEVITVTPRIGRVWFADDSIFIDEQGADFILRFVRKSGDYLRDFNENNINKIAKTLREKTINPQDNNISEQSNENTLTSDEQQIVDDILSVNESGGDWWNKFIQYGRKGLLTSAIVLALAFSSQATDSNKTADVIKTGTEMVDSQDSEDIYNFIIGFSSQLLADAKQNKSFNDNMNNGLILLRKYAIDKKNGVNYNIPRTADAALRAILKMKSSDLNNEDIKYFIEQGKTVRGDSVMNENTIKNLIKSIVIEQLNKKI